MGMTFRDRLVKEEGKRNKLYRDTSRKIGFEKKRGKVSIGIGYNIDDRGLPDDIVYLLLDRDISKIKREMNEHFPWASGMDWPRRSVLLEMIYNMGIMTVLRFKNTLAAMEAGNWKQAKKRLLRSKAARQLPKRYGRMAEILETGVM